MAGASKGRKIMSTTHKGITLNGRIADDIEFVPAANGKKARAQFGIIENDYEYEDGVLQRDDNGYAKSKKAIYQPSFIFDKLAERVAGTLQRGDAVIAIADLHFDTYKDGDQTRTSHHFVIQSIGPNLSATTVEVQRREVAAGTGTPDQSPVVAAAAADWQSNNPDDVWNSPSPAPSTAEKPKASAGSRAR